MDTVVPVQSGNRIPVVDRTAVFLIEMSHTSNFCNNKTSYPSIIAFILVINQLDAQNFVLQ